MSNISVYKAINEGKKIAPSSAQDHYFYLEDGCLYHNLGGKMIVPVHRNETAKSYLDGLLHRGIKWSIVE